MYDARIILDIIKAWVILICLAIGSIFVVFALLFSHPKSTTVPLPPWHQPPMCPAGEVCQR